MQGCGWWCLGPSSICVGSRNFRVAGVGLQAVIGWKRKLGTDGGAGDNGDVIVLGTAVSILGYCSI